MDLIEPTEEEKKAIHDLHDLPIIAIIKGLSSEDRKLIYDSIAVKQDYKKDFGNIQLPWISDFKHYWAQNHKYDPELDPARFSDDYIRSHECERFRLYYAAKYPERVVIEKPQNVKALEFMIETAQAIRMSKLISDLPKLLNN